MKKHRFAVLFLSICVAGSVVFLLFYNGIIWFNNPSRKTYPVRGVDVSSHQGLIDWKVLSAQKIDFAFIKATEGSSFRDKQFLYNWENARKTSLKVGAYHFFSYDSTGSAQAENFIRTVPKLGKSLPPVVDIEFYADKANHPPAKEKTGEILRELLNRLEKYYGKKPVIYATQKTYDLYIKGDYQNYAVWIRDVISSPALSDHRGWTFWQYSNRQVLKGYSGKEKYIDMNVYNGTKAEFNRFAG